MEKRKSPVAEALRVGAILLLICSLVAGVVSFVYALTADAYAENIAAVKREAISAIFGGEVDSTLVDKELPAGVLELYEVPVDGAGTHYCVNLNTPGFGGDMNMMVAIAPDGTVYGVQIVSMSETPGLGTRVGESDFLSLFTGKGGELVLGRDVDAIAGSTISSDAVLAGVNLALSAVAAHYDFVG